MLIAFSGLKGSGKDSAAKILVDEYGFTKIAFADALREALLVLDPIVGYLEYDCEMHESRLAYVIENNGWDWAKRNIPEVRRLMQVFGTEVGRQLVGENIWIDILAKRFPELDKSYTRYVITDCRFVNEAKFVDDKSGSIVWIDRPGVTSDGHASESDEVRKWRNWLIVNDGDLDDLHERVKLVMTREGIDSIER